MYPMYTLSLNGGSTGRRASTWWGLGSVLRHLAGFHRQAVNLRVLCSVVITSFLLPNRTRLELQKVLGFVHCWNSILSVFLFLLNVVRVWLVSVQNKKVFHQSFLFVFGNLVYLYFSLTADLYQFKKKVSLLADIFRLDLMDWSLALAITVKAKRKMVSLSELNWRSKC